MKLSLVYGSAVSACFGIALGLALHGPWQKDQHGGGPQLLFASAAAAERPAVDIGIVETAPPAGDAAPDAGPLPADSLPVTRLNRRGGTAIPASADIERVSAAIASPETDEVVIGGDSQNGAAPGAPIGDAR